MGKRALLAVVIPIIVLVAFLMGVVMFDRAQTAREQAYLATATVYIPPTTTTVPPTTVPAVAPAFSVTDEAGKVYSLEDFAGKPLVLCFWNESNAKARAELSVWNGILEKYGDKVNLVVVHINSVEAGMQSALTYLEGKNFAFTPYFDLSGDAAKAYEIGILPTTYFINAKGEWKARARGNIDISALPIGMESIGVAA